MTTPFCFQRRLSSQQFSLFCYTTDTVADLGCHRAKKHGALRNCFHSVSHGVFKIIGSNGIKKLRRFRKSSFLFRSSKWLLQNSRLNHVIYLLPVQKYVSQKKTPKLPSIFFLHKPSSFMETYIQPLEGFPRLFMEGDQVTLEYFLLLR